MDSPQKEPSSDRSERHFGKDGLIREIEVARQFRLTSLRLREPKYDPLINEIRAWLSTSPHCCSKEAAEPVGNWLIRRLDSSEGSFAAPASDCSY